MASVMAPFLLEVITALIHTKTLNGQSLAGTRSAGMDNLVSNRAVWSVAREPDTPALPSHKISNVAVGFLCVAPLLGFLLEAMVAGAMSSSEFTLDQEVTTALQTNKYWYITVLLNIGLSLWDCKRLEKAGVDTEGFGKTALIVPVYLWKRAKSLQSGTPVLLDLAGQFWLYPADLTCVMLF
jgi:hypothetical protein